MSPAGASSPRLSRRRLTRADLFRTLALMVLLLALVVIGALCMGSQLISPGTILAELISGKDSSVRTILFDLRLPRIALAFSAGAALASSGVLFQALLRNPLAEPYILGISNGCAVGAIAGFLLGVGPFGVPVLSFVGGAIVVMAVLGISRGAYGSRSESMLLGGVMIGAISAAMIFLLLHFVGPQLRSAIQWMLGDLASAPAQIGYGSLGLFLPIVVIGFTGGGWLNALALGDEEAASLGINVARARTLAYLAGSLVIGLTVAFCGAIGFVGLVVPHIMRRLVGPDHRALLPASIIGGSIFLILCDTLARSLMPAMGSAGSELPIGAITALVGAPIFILLLRRSQVSG